MGIELKLDFTEVDIRSFYGGDGRLLIEKLSGGDRSHLPGLPDSVNILYTHLNFLKYEDILGNAVRTRLSQTAYEGFRTACERGSDVHRALLMSLAKSWGYRPYSIGTQKGNGNETVTTLARQHFNHLSAFAQAYNALSASGQPILDPPLDEMWNKGVESLGKLVIISNKLYNPATRQDCIEHMIP